MLGVYLEILLRKGVSLDLLDKSEAIHEKISSESDSGEILTFGKAEDDLSTGVDVALLDSVSLEYLNNKFYN